MQISAPADPEVATSRRGGARSDLARALESLETGKAIMVTGILQSRASSSAVSVGKRTGRKFTTSLLDDGRVQILRVA